MLECLEQDLCNVCNLNKWSNNEKQSKSNKHNRKHSV